LLNDLRTLAERKVWWSSAQHRSDADGFRFETKCTVVWLHGTEMCEFIVTTAVQPHTLGEESTLVTVTLSVLSAALICGAVGRYRMCHLPLKCLGQQTN